MTSQQKFDHAMTMQPYASRKDIGSEGLLRQAAGYGNGRRLHPRHWLRSAPQLQGGEPQGTD